jgi:hypothetical protein
MLLMSSEQMVKALSEIKMDAPELKLQLKSTKDGKETTAAYVGKIEGEQIWIGLQSGPWVYSVPVTTIQELFDRIKLPEAAAQ